MAENEEKLVRVQSGSDEHRDLGQFPQEAACETCKMPTPPQEVGKRILCLNCGNFLSKKVAERAIIASQRKKPNPADSSGNTSTGKAQGRTGRLRSVFKFFSKGSKSRRTTHHSGSIENENLAVTLPLGTNKSNQNYTVALPLDTNKNRSIKVGTEESEIVADNTRSGNSKESLPLALLDDYTPEKVVQLLRESSRHDRAMFQNYLSVIYMSINTICKMFTLNDNNDKTNSCSIHFSLLLEVHELIAKIDRNTKRTIEKAIVGLLVKDRLVNRKTRQHLATYVILMQNPIFNDVWCSSTFAQLLNAASYVGEDMNSVLLLWFSSFPPNRLLAIVNRIKYFINCRLFPPKEANLPPIAQSNWWIPSALKVLALIYTSNEQKNIIKYSEFYIQALDHVDLNADFKAWKNEERFSYCRYSYVLSIKAKQRIVQCENEKQMEAQAKQTFMKSIHQRSEPRAEEIFLVLSVDRYNLVSDSLNKLMLKRHELKKRLRVSFVGEPGVDLGGPTKEWFLLLIRRVFRPEYGMFTFNKKAGVFWFTPSITDNLLEYQMVGILMGLAMYNGVILDVRFPSICYKKLLTPAVAPTMGNECPVGIINVGLEDLAQVDPDLSRSLGDLLSYGGNVEEDFCLRFLVSTERCGMTQTHELLNNGANIPVTNENRSNYVQLYVEWIINRSVYMAFKAFYDGFHSVCASAALMLLRPEEIEMLVCGITEFNIMDLKKLTVYEGYKANDKTIRYFWETLKSWPFNLQKRFLLFATGSDRVPPGGMLEMEFKISLAAGTDRLPIAFTCFNQVGIPDYQDRKQLAHKLLIAIENAEGFGLK